jgi:hypothetical protein
MGRGRAVGGGAMGARPCCSFGLLCSVCERRQEVEEKKEKTKKEKGKKKKRKKKKKMGKFCKHGNFRKNKIKDNL